MDDAKNYQQQLLEQARRTYYRTPISRASEEAFLSVPRHRFVQRYRDWASKQWHDVTADNLDTHLATLYCDRALTLLGDKDGHNTLSTISQPSFVLRMLDMLKLEEGQ
jgi:protein-L-isoaspartate O-methyltransferase